MGCDEYHLSASVAKHIDYVTPGSRLSRIIRKRTERTRSLTAGQRRFKGGFKIPYPSNQIPSTSANLSNCDNLITPACIAALYRFPEPANDTNPNNSLGIFEEGQFCAQEDLGK